MSKSEDNEVEEIENGRSLVLRAAGLVGIFFILARGLGLVREIIINGFLGTDSVAAQAYGLANQFPDAIFFVIAGGAMGSAFIPTFAAYFADDDEEGGWRLFSGVINLLLVVLIVVTAVTAVFAPQFVIFFFKQKLIEQPEILPETVKLMRIMLLSTLIFGVGGIVTAALQSHQHFLFPAIAPILYNVGIIVCGFLIKPPQLGLAIGAVVGSMGYLLVQLPALKQKGGKYTAVLTLRDPGIQKVLRLMGPRVLGLSFSRLNSIVIVFLTGRFTVLSNNSFVALNTALRVSLLPQGIIGQALGTAAFPTLATLAAKSNYGEIRKILSDSLRIIYFLALPITIVLMMLSTPIIKLLFERGEFTPESTRFTAWALVFFALGLFSLTALELINRTFFALSDTWTPVIAGAVQIVAMTLLSSYFSLSLFPSLNLLSLGGIALGFSLSNIVEVMVLWFLLRRKMGRLSSTYLLKGIGQMSLAGIVMAGLMWGTLSILPSENTLIQLISTGAVGAMAYFVACFALNIPELQQLLRLRHRFLP